MARYIGPKTKISRKFGEIIFGKDKYFERRKYNPGQHGNSRRRGKKSEYSIQLNEKQKLKYTYGVLERQCRKMFKYALKMKGNTGKILLQLFESRLDNTVYRLGLSTSRSGARQLVSHGHINVNNKKVNIPSYFLKPKDIITVRLKSKNHPEINKSINFFKKPLNEWLFLDEKKLTGVFQSVPEREQIPENINEQLIVEWYSK